MPVKPSARFALLLLLSHAVTASAVFATAMPVSAKLALLVPVFLSLPYFLARDVLLLLPGSWREISPARGRVSVVVREGSCFSGQIAGGTFVSPYIIVLRVRPDGHRLPVSRVIFPDALAAGAFRELCVHLRLT